MNIEITEFCPKGCSFCFNRSETGREMEMDEFRRVLAHLEKWQGSERGRLGIIGGEPTTHSCFSELVAHALSTDRWILTLFSNLWNIKITASAVGELLEAGGILVWNCNDVERIGAARWEEINNWLSSYISNYRVEQIWMSVTLSNNLTEKQIAQLLEHKASYGVQCVRLALDVNQATMGYDMGHRLLHAVRTLVRNGFLVSFDCCGYAPRCCLTETDFAALENIVDVVPVSCDFAYDVLVDGKLVPCMPAKHISSWESIYQYDSMEDAARFFATRFPTRAPDICKECSQHCDGPCRVKAEKGDGFIFKREK